MTPTNRPHTCRFCGFTSIQGVTWQQRCRNESACTKRQAKAS